MTEVRLRDRADARYDGHAASELATMLELPAVVVYDEVSSTLDVAHALGSLGAVSGTLVLADAQTAGRGRMGRSWHSEANAGIWLTLLERPSSDDLASVLSLRVALRLAPVLDSFVDGAVEVKWPNDLYVAGRKLAGVLLETRWHAGRLDWLAVGVGINMRLPRGMPAAALRAGTKRLDVLRAAVPAIRVALASRGPLEADERSAYARRDLALGRACLEPVEGIVAGIDPNGALLIDTETGRHAFRGGSLVLAGADNRKDSGGGNG